MALNPDCESPPGTLCSGGIGVGETPLTLIETEAVARRRKIAQIPTQMAVANGV